MFANLAKNCGQFIYYVIDSFYCISYKLGKEFDQPINDRAVFTFLKF
jgi:hypothetical protein